MRHLWLVRKSGPNEYRFTSGDGGGVIIPPTGPTQTKSYGEDSATNFINPERGYYLAKWYDGGQDLSYIRSSRGYSLGLALTHIDGFVNAPLSSAFLSQHANNLASLRSSGIKVGMRYLYNYGSGGDATLSRVMGHIDQLAPIWHEYADVIAYHQGGFIGAWGEMHSSTNNLTSPANVKTIIEGMLNATANDNKFVLVRYPRQVLFTLGLSYSSPSWPSGSPVPGGVAQPFEDATLAAMDRFGTSKLARLGIYDDSFITNAADGGTFSFPENGHSWESRYLDFLKNYTYDVWRYTPVIGEISDYVYEAAPGGSKLAPAAAYAELPLTHVDTIHRDYGAGFITTWNNTNMPGGGTYGAEIERRLGYRLVLHSATLPVSVQRGGQFQVSLVMSNRGYGKVYNPRPVDLVLVPTGGGSAVTVRLSSDARKNLPLGGEASKSMTFTGSLSGGLATGNYAAYLSLPDPATTLQGDVRYHIRLANGGSMWNASTGRHDLDMFIGVTA